MRTHYTDKQIEVENWINNLGFQTELEQVFGVFCADIYIPELNWIIEIDGPQHYGAKDDRRDAYLFSQYKIFYIMHVKSTIKKNEFKILFTSTILLKLGGNLESWNR